MRLSPGLHPPHAQDARVIEKTLSIHTVDGDQCHFHSSQKGSADETDLHSGLKCCLYCCGILGMLLEGKGWFDYIDVAFSLMVG